MSSSREPDTAASDVEVVGSNKRVRFSSTPTPGATAPNPSRPAQKKLFSAIALNDDWLDSCSEFDVKPVVPKAGLSSSEDKGKGKAPCASSSKDIEVLELPSGAESENNSQQKRKKSKLERDLSRIRAVVPDAHSSWLIKLYRDPSFERDPNRIVEELLTSNYPLRDGGWKYSRDEGEKGKQEGGKSSKNKSEVEKANAKKAEVEEKGKRKQRGSEDEDEEVDQLDEDEEQAADDEDEDEAKEYTMEEAIAEAEYWLGNVNRKFGDDAYRKAALLQLFRDYNAYAENHIRNRFESDKCGQLYSPTWMELYRLKKAGDLLPLKNGPRDMDKPYKAVGGKEKMRKEAPRNKLLKEEIDWLEAYVVHNGCKLEANRKEARPDMIAERPSPKKRTKKESPDERRTRTKGKNKKAASSREDEEDDLAHDCDDCCTCDGARGRNGHPTNSPGWGPAYTPPSSRKSGKKRGGSAYKGQFGGGVWMTQEDDVKPFQGLETSKSSQLFRSSSRTPSPQLVTRLKVEDKDENGEPSSEEEEEQADSQRLEKDDKRAVTSPQCPKTPAAPAPFPYTPPANTSRRETYDLVLQNVPAVHPAYLVHLLNIPDFHADANESVAELLTNEYPLARGGWKQGGVTPAAEFTMKWRTRQAEVPTMPTVPRREPAEEPAVVYRPVVVPTRQAPSPTRQYTTPGPFDAFGLGYGYQKAGTGIFGGGGFGGAARGGSWSGGKGARADQARRSSQTLGEGSDGRDEPAEVKRQRLVTAALKRAHSESRSQTQG
ncbi:splicing coactivator [Rhodotorula toruloides]|uniref:Splicing coactivator n=1 Tax=Rhodotorula toruloides TaxID=5286 RepID=A0A511K8Z2_RHOTO|nr:splicing coactivator [Rhodotorula toruloides]